MKLSKMMHGEHTATVITDAETDELKIWCATKQGDPLSSLLFNAVLQQPMENTSNRGWRPMDLGSDSEKVKRIARDVILMATSLRELKK